MRSRSIFFPRDAATWRELTALLMSPLATMTSPFMASSSIWIFSWATIFLR